MVMPGLRGDPRTPGGMPDSGSVNPGGPMPSVPQNRGQSMGAGVSPPDPGKLEELFTQYTSGQMSREDLISQLHTFSEGQGGILGLLEKSDTTPGEDTSMPSMPGPAGPAGPMPGAMPGAASGTMPGPMPSDIPGQPTTNALGEEIPPLEEPLDERHQHISRLLQEYGLESHDADQMSSVLNPHAAGHRKEWSDDEGLWMETWDDPEKQKASLLTPEQGGHSGIWYDPTVTAASGSGNINAEGLSGAGALEERMRAGLGTTTGSRGAGYVSRTGEDGSTSLEFLGDRDLLPKGSQADTAASNRALGAGGQAKGVESAWSDQRQYADDEGVAPGRSFGITYDETSGKYYTSGGQEVRQSGSTASKAVVPEIVKPIETGIQGDIPDKPILGDPNQRTAFNDFWGGFYDPKDYQRTHHNIPPKTKGPAYWDKVTETWFPNEGVFKQFQDWSKPGGEGAFYGNPEITPEFSHWIDPVTGNIIPTWKLQDKSKSGWGNKKKIGIAKNSTRIVVDYKDDEDKTVTKTYNVNTSGMSQTEINALRSDMINGFYIPFNADGSPTVGADRWQPGYDPNNPLKAGGKNPSASTIHSFAGGSRTKETGGEIVKPGGDLPPGWEFVDAGDGNTVLVNKTTGESVDVTSDGTYKLPPSATPPVGDGPEGSGGAGAGDLRAEVVGALDMAGATRYEFPVLYDAVHQLVSEEVSPLANEDVAQTLLTVIASIENTKQTLREGTTNRMFDVTQRLLDEKAADARAALDRDVQKGALIGEIDNTITAAKQAEDVARIFEAARQAGQVPVWDSQNEKWMLSEIPPDMLNNVIDDTGQLSLEAKMFSQNLAATKEDKIRNYQISLASLFGTTGVIQYADDGTKLSDNADLAVQQTLEARKFGLTEAIAAAEITGVIPTEMHHGTRPRTVMEDGYVLPAINISGMPTLEAKRFALEKDLKWADTQYRADQLNLESRRVNNNYTIEENKISLQRHIANGELAEAVEARKDQTWLASEKLRLDRDKMKVDVLMSLNTPATFLFANRSGLLDNIGAALGIDFSDSVPSSIPSLINPNTIPTLIEFNAATPEHQQMMLVEMASDANIGSMEQAAKMIYEASPGAGREIRRPSILSAGR